MHCYQKRKLYSDRLQQLNRLRLALPLEDSQVSSQVPNIKIEQSGAEIECPIVDLPGGRSLFVVWLSVSTERPGVRLFDFRFEPPWQDDAFEALPPFLESRRGERYILPNGVDYGRDEVLNFNFVEAGWSLPSTRV